MRRMIRRDEEDPVEPEGLPGLMRDGEMTVVYWIEATAEESKTKRARVSSGWC